MSSIVKFKANKALERHRDPRESLDYSYQRQLERLTKLRRGVADVAYQRKRAELQIESLRQQLARLERAAERAQGAGSDDPAAEASSREAAQNQLNDVERQYQTLQADEEWLTAVSLRFQQKVDGFRTQKEVLNATYSAAEAKNRIGEAFSGITNELGEIGMAMRRAPDKTTHMQGRSDATEELRASGAFDDITALSPEEFPDELERIETHIDAELARLKAEISAGPARAIAASTGNGDQASAAGQPHAGEGS